jgi:hypothetical protein
MNKILILDIYVYYMKKAGKIHLKFVLVKRKQNTSMVGTYSMNYIKKYQKVFLFFIFDLNDFCGFIKIYC